MCAGGGGGRLIRRGRVLAIVADAVNVIKTFFCLIITLPTAPVGVAQSTQSVHLPPIIPKQTLSPLPLSPAPFHPSWLLDWVIALLIKCISYALTFYLCMRAQVEPQSQRTHGRPLL